MNVWDIIDNIKIFDIKIGRAVVITVFAAMLLIPTFSRWMINQALQREQATAQAVGNLAGQAITQSINQSVKLGTSTRPVSPAPAPDPRYPAPVYLYPNR